MRKPSIIPFNGAFYTKDGQLHNLDGASGPLANASDLTPFTGVFIGSDGEPHDITELLEGLGGGNANNGLPPGGSIGQMLIKDGVNDYDTAWVDRETGIPDGGNQNEVLAKASTTDGHVKWWKLSGTVIPYKDITGALTIAAKMDNLQDGLNEEIAARNAMNGTNIPISGASGADNIKYYIDGIRAALNAITINLTGDPADGSIKAKIDEIIANLEQEIHDREEADQNFYTKNSTYTKEEINNLITSYMSGLFVIVPELPTEDISTSNIYLVPHNHDDQAPYDEYIYVEDAWVFLGITELVLTGYVKAEYSFNRKAVNELTSVTSTSEVAIINFKSFNLDGGGTAIEDTLTIPAATSETAGVMTAEDKTKLDEVSATFEGIGHVAVFGAFDYIITDVDVENKFFDFPAGQPNAIFETLHNTMLIVNDQPCIYNVDYRIIESSPALYRRVDWTNLGKDQDFPMQEGDHVYILYNRIMQVLGGPGEGAVIPSGGIPGQVLTRGEGPDGTSYWDDMKGHNIISENGTTMPYRNNIQFISSYVTDAADQDTTVVDLFGNDRPAKPLMIRPYANEILQGRSVRLELSEYFNPYANRPFASTQFQVSRTENFNLIVYDTVITQSSILASTNAEGNYFLETGRQYYARGRYMDVRGVYSLWSDIVRFEVPSVIQEDYIETPTLIYPADGAVVGEDSIFIAGSTPQPVGDVIVSKMDCVVATDQGFTDGHILKEINDSTQIPAISTPYNGHLVDPGNPSYVKMRYKNDDSTIISPWTAPHTFYIQRNYNELYIGAELVFQPSKTSWNPDKFFPTFMRYIDLEGNEVSIPKSWFDNESNLIFNWPITTFDNPMMPDRPNYAIRFNPVYAKCEYELVGPDGKDGIYPPDTQFVRLWLSPAPMEGFVLHPAFAFSPTGFYLSALSGDIIEYNYYNSNGFNWYNNGGYLEQQRSFDAGYGSNGEVVVGYGVGTSAITTDGIQALEQMRYRKYWPDEIRDKIHLWSVYQYQYITWLLCLAAKDFTIDNANENADEYLSDILDDNSDHSGRYYKINCSSTGFKYHQLIGWSNSIVGATSGVSSINPDGICPVGDIVTGVSIFPTISPSNNEIWSSRDLANIHLAPPSSPFVFNPSLQTSLTINHTDWYTSDKPDSPTWQKDTDLFGARDPNHYYYSYSIKSFLTNHFQSGVYPEVSGDLDIAWMLLPKTGLAYEGSIAIQPSYDMQNYSRDRPALVRQIQNETRNPMWNEWLYANKSLYTVSGGEWNPIYAMVPARKYYFIKNDMIERAWGALMPHFVIDGLSYYGNRRSLFGAIRFVIGD